MGSQSKDLDQFLLNYVLHVHVTLFSADKLALKRLTHITSSQTTETAEKSDKQRNQIRALEMCSTTGTYFTPT